jgi:carbonic anhydrase
MKSMYPTFLKVLSALMLANCLMKGSFSYAQSAAVGQHTEQKPEWMYRGNTGVNHWGELALEYSPCADGKYQSPINIRHSTKKANHRVHLDYRPSFENVLNNGHTVELVYDQGSSLEFDGKRYQLTQVHFHTPAEHLTFDKEYPMEMHLVHRSSDTTYLVVGVWFREGKASEVLSRFEHYIPADVAENNVAQQFTVAPLFPAQPHYFHYQGSFTTPPCRQGVRWLMLKEVQEASAEQIRAIRSVEGNNARPNQKLHHREVEEF